MELNIEKISASNIAYIRQVGPYGSDNFKTMESLKYWAERNNLFNDQSVILGIAHDDPQKTNPEDCRYDTCFIIPDDVIITDEAVKIGTIAGGSYAVFTISHTAEAVQNAWAEIFPELAKQGYLFDESRPIFERYQMEMVKAHLCEICIPVK